jgi:G3E family GTPase
VIVNEFGAVGIDHLLTGTSSDRVRLLDAGCLCCVMTDSLRETLADLYHQRSQHLVPPFTRVLIETSGLADPAPILQTLLRDAVVAPLFSLAGVVCVIDALHAEAQLDEHVEAAEQVAYADHLVVSKLAAGDAATSASTPASTSAQPPAATPSPALLRRLRAVNPHAPISAIPVAPGGGVESPESSVAPLFRFDGLRFEPPRRPAAAPSGARHSADIESWVVEIATPVSWAGIAAWIAQLREGHGTDLLRCKALLRLRDRPGRVVVQGVRALFETHHDATLETGSDAAPIVCIGRHLDRAALRASLEVLEAP